MKKKFVLVLVTMIVFVLAVPLSVFASPAAIRGTVTDSVTGAPVGGVEVLFDTVAGYFDPDTGETYTRISVGESAEKPNPVTAEDGTYMASIQKLKVLAGKLAVRCK